MPYQYVGRQGTAQYRDGAPVRRARGLGTGIIATVILLAGIDLLRGRVYAPVRHRHRSRESIEFLKLLDAGYPPHTAVKLILDRHSAQHVQVGQCVARAAAYRSASGSLFTPTHGSWLKLIEGVFSKLDRAVLRYVRVESKGGLKDMAAMDYLNQEPVVHTWSYTLDRAK